MRKIILLIIIILLTTGCNPTKNMTCQLSYKDNNNKIKSEHVIVYRGNKVVLLRSTEIIKNDELDLSILQKELNLYYQHFNELEYYTNINLIEDNQLISKTTINYEKVNIKKLKKMDKSINELLDGNTISKKKLISKYKKENAICK